MSVLTCLVSLTPSLFILYSLAMLIAPIQNEQTKNKVPIYLKAHKQIVLRSSSVK